MARFATEVPLDAILAFIEENYGVEVPDGKMKLEVIEKDGARFISFDVETEEET